MNDKILPENLLVGRNPIREALKSGRPMEKLLISKGDLSAPARQIADLAREKGVVVQMVDRARLDAITENHQGILAYVSAATYSTVEDMLKLAEERGEPPFLLALDGVTDPQNLGAIIRTAVCAGAHGVIVTERRSAGLSPACAKAAAGALEYAKVARVVNLSRTIDELKEKGVWVCAADMDGTPYDKADLTGPLMIVIGSEGEGVSRLVREKCDFVASLPMRGPINSLNASVAAGILTYAALRAREAAAQ